MGYLGLDDDGAFVDDLDPEEADRWLAVAIDLLGRLRSDGADALLVTAGGTRTDSDDHPAELVASWPEWDRVGSSELAAGILDSVRGSDLRDGGDGLG